MDHVRLRPLEPEDLNLVVALRLLPEAHGAAVAAPPTSDADARRALNDRLQSPTERLFLIDLIDEDGDAAPVGACGLHGVDPKNRVAEVRLVVPAAQHQGRGLGAAALRRLVAIAFDDLNLQRLELAIVGEAPRAVRCAERAGFRREGARRAAALHGGRRMDVVVMALLSDERPS